MNEPYDSQEEYNADLLPIIMLAQTVLTMNPSRVLRAIRQSQNIGHIFHPTAYRQAMTELDRHEKVIEAVSNLRKVMLEVTEKAASDG